MTRENDEISYKGVVLLCTVHLDSQCLGSFSGSLLIEPGQNGRSYTFDHRITKKKSQVQVCPIRYPSLSNSLKGFLCCDDSFFRPLEVGTTKLTVFDTGRCDVLCPSKEFKIHLNVGLIHIFIKCPLFKDVPGLSNIGPLFDYIVFPLLFLSMGAKVLKFVFMWTLLDNSDKSKCWMKNHEKFTLERPLTKIRFKKDI